MKRKIAIALFCILTSSLGSYAQETYARTLNVGLGVGGYSGYYGHVGRSLPVFHIDYEFDVAKDFTLAPFISVYSFSNDYYWGNNNSPFKNYSYHETVIPIGAKGTYYFDDLLNATSKWDFYAAGSLGFAIVSSSWDAGYNGDRNYYRSPSSLFLDIHIGAEYHFNKNVGAFLDLSSGASTIGIAIHGIK
jgi:hypothetical protein